METSFLFSSFIIVFLATILAARFFVSVVMKLRIPAVRIFVVAIVGFVLYQVVIRIHVGYWDPFFLIAFIFGMPIFLLVSTFLEIILSRITAPMSFEMVNAESEKRWIVRGRLIMGDMVLKKRFILTLLALILLGYGWLPPFSITLIFLLCSIRLWLLGKKKILIFCLLLFLVFLISPSVFLQEGEGEGSFFGYIFFLGLLVSQITLFLMIYASLDSNHFIKKEGRETREDNTT
jgi:hypothetical protein